MPNLGDTEGGSGDEKMDEPRASWLLVWMEG